MTEPDYFDTAHYAALRSALGYGDDVHSKAVTTRTPEEHEAIIVAKQAAIDVVRRAGLLDEGRDDGRDVTGAWRSSAEIRAGLRRAIREAR